MLMNKKLSLIKGLLLMLLVLIVATIKAEISLPQLFSDHVVLQREVEVPIWGWASPEEAVTVSIAGQVITTLADKNGEWRLKLAPHPAGGRGCGRQPVSGG